jgi:MFS family permease
MMLFVARILDGITGGNNSVAQAVIADSTEGKDRARAFGILGAAFGLGFLLGPALGGVLSNYGLTVPFWFASGLALIGTIAGVFLLKETLPPNSRQTPGSAFLTPKALLEAFVQPLTGIVLIISLFYTIGLNSWIIGFQSFTNDVLELSAQKIGLLFALFGLVTVIMQGWGVGVILKKIASKKRILIGSLFLSVLSVIPMFFTSTFVPFTAFIMIFAIVSSPIGPVISALLSERTKAEDQGGIMGINQAVISLGQIFGPLMAGAVSQTSIHLIFLLSAMIMLISTVAGKWLYIPSDKKVDL